MKRIGMVAFLDVRVGNGKVRQNMSERAHPASSSSYSVFATLVRLTVAFALRHDELRLWTWHPKPTRTPKLMLALSRDAIFSNISCVPVADPRVDGTRPGPALSTIYSLRVDRLQEQYVT